MVSQRATRSPAPHMAYICRDRYAAARGAKARRERGQAGAPAAWRAHLAEQDAAAPGVGGEPRRHVEDAAADLGCGRIVTLYYRPSTSYHIH